MKEIARKKDFGCRIRNACVVGSLIDPYLKDKGTAAPSSQPRIKLEPGDPEAFGFSSRTPPTSGIQLPPQLLAVVLETGDTVFLFLRPGPSGKPEFVVSRYGRPRLKNWCPGFHLAVNPSSRYMAVGGAADYFVIYELESHGQLNQSYLGNEPLRPIKSFRLRSVRGVIQSMTFLHPRPGDDHHIILLLIIVRHGKSRTVIYEWELGDDLQGVFAEEKLGHRMPREYQMPLLVVPLTLQSNFIIVTPDDLAMVSECLHGPPKYEDITIVQPEPTDNHRGHGRPLWTAWMRPPRLQKYTSDCVYFAREDGVVIFLTISGDMDIDCDYIDTFACNISRAFACLLDQFDVLMLGSDSGPGGYWKVCRTAFSSWNHANTPCQIVPKYPSEMLGTLPNWSPVVDFITTHDASGRRQEVSFDKVMEPWQRAKPRRPDRIFATCDGTRNGSITEYRYGLRANIGLDLEYGDGVKHAWLLPSQDSSLGKGYLLLLSMPDSSSALFLSHDFSSAKEPAADTMPFDLGSTTLALTCSAQLTVQVTKQNVVLVAQDRRYGSQSTPIFVYGTNLNNIAIEFHSKPWKDLRTPRSRMPPCLMTASPCQCTQMFSFALPSSRLKSPIWGFPTSRRLRWTARSPACLSVSISSSWWASGIVDRPSWRGISCARGPPALS